jgi:hypothetical protein
MRNTNEQNYFNQKKEFIDTTVKNKGNLAAIAENFTKYISRQQLSRFLLRQELFKKVLDMKGSIVECGVYEGAGLMMWAHLSSIYEPYNYHREIIGFDSFAGFPSISPKDKGKNENSVAVVGGLKSSSYEELLECIKLYDMNRPLAHKNKVKLVKGDFLKTGKEYLKDNNHMLISLLYLDFDIYEPTKEALKLFMPRMSKGSIIAFDELNNPDWPGETQAVLEEINLREYELKQFSFEPNVSYIVL